MEDEIRQAVLANVPEALEFWRVDESPE